MDQDGALRTSGRRRVRTNFDTLVCLSYFHVTVKRHQDKAAYRWQSLLRLTVIEGASGPSWEGAWQQAGRSDGGELTSDTQA